MNPLDVAIQVAGRVQGLQVTIRGKERLNVIVRGMEFTQIRNRKRRGCIVDRRSRTGHKVFNVLRKNGRGVWASVRYRISRFGTV